MAKSKIYALYDNDVLVGEYTLKEIAELIGMSIQRVRSAASDGIKLGKRYYMEAVREKETKAEAFVRDWNETIALYRANGVDLSKVKFKPRKEVKKTGVQNKDNEIPTG